ncbi:MAG: class I SAM-dependent methyltransferase [Pseudomonadota bacterium]
MCKKDNIAINFTSETYKKWHEKYVNATNEKDLVEKNIRKHIFPLIPEKSNFLDIGAGDGNLTLRFLKDFKKTTVVEPIKEVKDTFINLGIEFINLNFQDTEINDKFDFILCSQVFWLVERTNQKAFITKMRNLLSETGKLAIIMVSPIGQSYDFYKRFFYNYDTTTHDILIDLHEMNLKAEIIPIKFSFGTESFDDFFDILKLFTVESWLHPNKKSSQEKLKKETIDIDSFTKTQLLGIEEFIKSNCKTIAGNFKMDEEIDIITVSRQ